MFDDQLIEELQMDLDDEPSSRRTANIDLSDMKFADRVKIELRKNQWMAAEEAHTPEACTKKHTLQLVNYGVLFNPKNGAHQ